jgi:hypothetical protein
MFLLVLILERILQMEILMFSLDKGLGLIVVLVQIMFILEEVQDEVVYLLILHQMYLLGQILE